MLNTGDAFPHIDVETHQGRVFQYATIWQQANFVLAVLPSSDNASAYIEQLAAADDDFRRRNTRCVVTREPVAGLPVPAVVIADRWGEIVHVAAPGTVAQLPTPRDLIDWVDWIERRCPECEGESK